MADNNSTDLPAGVSLVCEYDTLRTFVGAESAFVSAGWIRPEWLAGLGRYARQIALHPQGQGGFAIIHEGKGNGLKHHHREAGAVAVRCLADGQMQFTKYKTMTERREEKRLLHEKREREAWEKSKQARDDDQDYPRRWKQSIAHYIDKLATLVDGRLVFEGLPDIKLSAHDLARMKSAIGYLRQEFDAVKPIVNDIEAKDNIISLRTFAHSRLKSASR